jgi:DNA-binding MarR family transcriptional regulator
MRWRAAVDRAAAPLGLTHTQYSVLASLFAIEQSGHAPSQRELAEQTGLDAIFVSKLSRTLERSGRIVRPEDPTDSRAVRLRLTDDGRATIRRAIGVVHDLLDELTAPLGGLDSARTRSFVEDILLLLEAREPIQASPYRPTPQESRQ